MNLKIYTNPHCPFSDQAKKFFKKKKIKFEELTLFKEAETRLEMIDKSFQMATPVIELDEELIIGFDEKKLAKLIKEKKKNSKNNKKK